MDIDNFNYFPDVRKGDDPFVGVIVGRKGSGKTSLLLDLLKTVWKKTFNLIVIVSPTFSLQSLSSEISDGRGIVIISEFRPCIIQELETFQNEKIKKKQKMLAERAHNSYFDEEIPEDIMFF